MLSIVCETYVLTVLERHTWIDRASRVGELFSFLFLMSWNWDINVIELGL